MNAHSPRRVKKLDPEPRPGLRGGRIPGSLNLPSVELVDTRTMTMRYAHLSQEHKKKAVNLLNGLTTLQNACDQNGHKMVTFSNPSTSTNDQVLEITGRDDWI